MVDPKGAASAETLHADGAKSLLPLLAVLAEGAEGAAPGLGDAASRALFAGAQARTTNYYLLATTYYELLTINNY